MQEEIEAWDYWDTNVLSFNIIYFGDEVSVVWEENDYDVELLFTGCSSLSYVTSPEDRLKPIKELTRPQLPYFLHDIKVTDIERRGIDLFKLKITMPPLFIDIICTDITIRKTDSGIC